MAEKDTMPKREGYLLDLALRRQVVAEVLVHVDVEVLLAPEAMGQLLDLELVVGPPDPGACVDL